VNWTNTKKTSCVAALVLLAGCANQDTILPPAERQMIDIYREAMNQVEGPTAPTIDPEVICSTLVLEETPEECVEKLAAHAEAVYRHIDETWEEQPLEYETYTRSVLTEIDNLFPRHDNPDMVIYVYPHLATRTRAPIPGYTTVIPLYERIEYRLPGESLLTTPQSERPEIEVMDDVPGAAAEATE